MLRVKDEILTGYHSAWALGVCCLSCLGCFAYLVKGTKNIEHRCGKCSRHLATWHRSGTTEVHAHS